MRTLVGYAIIGGLGVGVYLGGLWLLLRAGLGQLSAVTIAYVFAVALQFTLNRWLNFKAFDRPVHHQAPVYFLTAGLNYLLTIGTMTLAVRFLHVGIFFGNVLAVMVTLPVGFLSARCLAFAKG